MEPVLWQMPSLEFLVFNSSLHGYMMVSHHGSRVLAAGERYLLRCFSHGFHLACAVAFDRGFRIEAMHWAGVDRCFRHDHGIVLMFRGKQDEREESRFCSPQASCFGLRFWVWPALDQQRLF